MKRRLRAALARHLIRKAAWHIDHAADIATANQHLPITQLQHLVADDLDAAAHATTLAGRLDPKAAGNELRARATSLTGLQSEAELDRLLTAGIPPNQHACDCRWCTHD